MQSSAIMLLGWLELEEGLARRGGGVVSDLETKSETVSQERILMRWAGIAGILGGLVFILVPVVQFGFVSPGTIRSRRSGR